MIDVPPAAIPEPSVDALIQPRGLTQGAEDWQRELPPMLASWEVLDDHRLSFVRSALGSDALRFDWSQLSSFIDVEAAFDVQPDSPVRRVRRGWAASFSGTRLDEAAEKLLTHWLLVQDRDLAMDAVRWAVRLGSWEVLSNAWLNGLISEDHWRDPELSELVAALPVEARQVAPLLSVVRGIARGELTGRAGRHAQLKRDLIADCAELHSHWRQAPSLDAAVQAGTLWMLIQRTAPAISPAGAVDSAVRTQSDVAQLLESERDAGRTPSRKSEALFHLISSHTVFSAGDLNRAVSEAEYSAALDGDMGRAVAGGTGALARELVGYSAAIAELPETCWARPGVAIGVVESDLTAGRLAVALGAVRRLDRRLCDQALAAVGRLPYGAVRWTVLLYVRALRSAVWGDPAEALRELDRESAKHALVSVENHERLGAGLLRRARAVLLDRLGARIPSCDEGDAFPRELCWVAQAGSRLWAGEFEQAVSVANEGLFDSRTLLSDRFTLQAIKAAAQFSNSTLPQAERDQVAFAVVDDSLDAGLLFPLAVLPAATRIALVDSYRRQATNLSSEREGLLARLDSIAQGRAAQPGPIHLTRRERLLLPLLASDESVPEIAERLQVSPNTVRKQVVGLRKKFGASSRAELVRLARGARR